MSKTNSPASAEIDVDSIGHSEDSSFKEFCQSLIKVSTKNRIIKARLHPELIANNSISPESFEVLVNRELNSERKRRSVMPGPSLLVPVAKRYTLPINSCLIWYIMKGKGCRDVLPDYELTYCREIFRKMLKGTPNGETHFGLGKLLFHDENIQESLYHFAEALKYSNDMIFKQWHSFVFLQCSCHNREEARGIYQRLTGNYHLESLKLEASIENYWGLLTLALKNLLRPRYEIELPQFYATKIKAIDTYYGYIAYSEVFISEGNLQMAMSVLTELVAHNPSRPEAYMELWKIYYENNKQFALAEDLMTQAFLRVNDAEYDSYMILFALNLAKVYSKQRKFYLAFEILQEKFVDHPSLPVFLYQYGRLCTKAEDATFIGSAIGALRECLRLCDEKRHGKINYWLGKAYHFNKQYFESYLAINVALEKLGVGNNKKTTHLRELLKYIKVSISNAEIIYGMWKRGAEPRKLLEACEGGIHFECVKEIKAEMLWKLGEKDKAVDYLKICIKESPKYLPFRFQLAKYLKKTNNIKDLIKVCKKMVKYSKNIQVITPHWVRCNIWYARAQSLSNKPEKALPVLQCLSKVFPPLPYTQIPYTKQLIKAKGASDFMFAACKASRHRVYDFYNVSSSVVYTTENTTSSFEEHHGQFAIKQRREFAENFIDESVEEESSFDISNIVLPENDRLSITQKSFDVTMSRFSERGFMTFASGTVPTGNRVFVGFSVCSEILFLYYIAKVALKHETNLDDGLCAVHDFLGLTGYEQDETIKDLYRVKGRFVKSLLLILSDRAEYGRSLLRETRPHLERLCLNAKLEVALKYLSS